MQGLRNRVRLLRHIAAVGVIAGAAAGCSSDFTRFDAGVTGSTAPTSSAANPYPGDVDATTTASVGGGAYGSVPRPMGSVGAYPAGADHQGYTPSYSPGATASTYPPRSSQPNPGTYNPGTYNPDNQPAYKRRGQTVAQADMPRLAPSAAQTDTLTTSSIQPAAPARTPEKKPASNRVVGWSADGGATVTVQPGETVYNLSKRYGIPVDAIKKANGITDVTKVRAGQSIIIPKYAYGSNAPVSAPDADPRTRYASSLRGSLYAPSANAVPVPERRPQGQYTNPGVDPMKVASIPQKKSTLPPGVDPMVTGTVKNNSAAGDNDRRLAERMGTQGSPKPYIKPGSTTVKRQAAVEGEIAPPRTGIDEFRWPVRGRVISNFGDKIASGRNDGIDISVPEGTAVRAAENGVVIYSGSDLEGFGNLILIRHADGIVTAYAHNKANHVKKGAEVKRGQQIAASGRSGSATVPMLHFEVRKNAKPVNPEKYLGG